MSCLFSYWGCLIGYLLTFYSTLRAFYRYGGRTLSVNQSLFFFLFHLYIMSSIELLLVRNQGDIPTNYVKRIVSESERYVSVKTRLSWFPFMVIIYDSKLCNPIQRTTFTEFLIDIAYLRILGFYFVSKLTLLSSKGDLHKGWVKIILFLWRNNKGNLDVSVHCKRQTTIIKCEDDSIFIFAYLIWLLTEKDKRAQHILN